MSGNVFPDTSDVGRDEVPEILSRVSALLPSNLEMQPNIGSAGFKSESGDMDLFLDQQQLIDQFSAKDEKTAKQELAKYLQQTGLQTAVKGRNVYIRMPKSDGHGFAQVDLMVIPDAAQVAPWHQHGPRGSYEDPEFKGAPIVILMNSIGKALGLKFDAFSGRLLRRDNNEVVAGPARDAVAAQLIPGATGDDFNSVKHIIDALASDPLRDSKLAQARDDAARGLITLPGA